MPRLSMPLFWRVCLINGAVFLLGTLVLALSPATVSARPLLSELVVLLLGLTVIVLVNGALLRTVLRPLDRLTAVTGQIDLRHPGLRLDEEESGPARPLVRGFNAMLERLEVERSTSTARALQAQEAERQRIAQELHDEVGQSLTAVLLGLRHLMDTAPERSRAELDELRGTTRTSLEEVRRISERLRPGDLTELGLVSALAGLARATSARNGPVVRRSLPSAVPELSSETELVIYRVAQEALTNVVRHARAGTVDLSLALSDAGLVLRVVDDGVGIPPGAMGAGIQGMLERAQMIGGELDVRSHGERGRRSGTEVRLSLPLPRRAEP
ncbi:HAMP domain-containing sensor histidine kinase [Myceligenerans xiligouense]|uniref:histidine kinase n=1 Tax=Myceligenerans xiligouense TaxID=253184 RepID=A0A3N4YVH6_9MICO|nr:histidine kinase [Myceligenerans xiligouense]RPF23404.1 two-component system sensor histidine kinase UhpB [Myceligenerans xiligouense]